MCGGMFGGWMMSLCSVLARLMPSLHYSRRGTTSFTLSSDFWQIAQVISSTILGFLVV